MKIYMHLFSCFETRVGNECAFSSGVGAKAVPSKKQNIIIIQTVTDCKLKHALFRALQINDY